MIAIRKQDGVYAPVVICDHCGQVIDDASNANEISSGAPEGTTAQAFHVHKGECDRTLSAKIGGLWGSAELSDHLVELLLNTLKPNDLARARKLLAAPGR